MKINQLIPLTLIFAVVGCANNSVQTTSGQAYLDKYAHVPIGSTPTGDSGDFDIDAAVRQAAAIEPVLEFPARIGLVRIGQWGRISGIPLGEAEHWTGLAERLGARFGEFVPINPLVAELANPKTHRANESRLDVISQVRLAAARQHLDAVLLYEVRTSNEIEQNAMAATDFAIVTAFVLPSRRVKGEAIGTALLIDVIQGYPYGTVESRVQEQKLATSWGARSKGEAIAERLRASVTAELVNEAESMFTELRTQLAEQRLDAYRQNESRPSD